LGSHRYRILARIAQEKNEKSKGKEGGRIVRKLIADLVGTPIQAAIAARMEEYKNCNRVRIHLTNKSTPTVVFE